jgi:hypothetical protein
MIINTTENRRVNLLIQQKKLNENQPVGESKPEAANERLSSAIVSRHLWPPFKKEEVELHENLRGIYDDCASEYSVFKDLIKRSLNRPSRINVDPLYNSADNRQEEFVRIRKGRTAHERRYGSHFVRVPTNIEQLFM